ncbi:MAG: DNA-binding protein WhiA [Fretibacterium sp.]|nr:DNA-binding protein WhiA [Fretibacterium sp.]
MLSRRNHLVDALWDEWGLCPAEGKDVRAECMGMLAGLLPTFKTNRLRVVRRLMRLWRQSPWYPELDIADIVSFPEREQGRRGSVLISLPSSFQETVGRFASDLAHDLAERGHEPMEKLPSVFWSWLRGLWGSCGGLYLPKSGYYLVFRVGFSSVAGPMRSILSRTELRWRGRVFHGAQEMFLRDQESIVTFLCNLGLPSSSLKMEDRAIMRSLRDQANRVSNCDTANIRRALRVAEEQTRLAARVSQEGLLPLLPPALRQLAEVRLANPEASLSELGKKLTPPIQKSTVKYRWARLNDYVSKKKKECCRFEAEDI